MSAPQALGALAIAGAVFGSLNAGDALPVDGRITAATPFSGASQAGAFDDRSMSASRSTSRGARGEEAAIDRLAGRRERELENLSRQADRRSREIEAARWVLPMPTYRLTGRFGDRSWLWSTVHTGLDFAAPTGTAIHAVASGRVTEAGWAGPYGNRTIVMLPDGTEVWYCHQSRIDVRVGEQVARGQSIGAVGSTGNVTGPHLHLEVRPGGGDAVDPYAALTEHGAQP